MLSVRTVYVLSSLQLADSGGKNCNMDRHSRAFFPVYQSASHVDIDLPLRQAMTRDECKFPCEVLHGNRRTGFDCGVNAFHPNDITLPKAIVIGRVHEDK